MEPESRLNCWIKFLFLFSARGKMAVESGLVSANRSSCFTAEPSRFNLLKAVGRRFFLRCKSISHWSLEEDISQRRKDSLTISDFPLRLVYFPLRLCVKSSVPLSAGVRPFYALNGGGSAFAACPAICPMKEIHFVNERTFTYICTP